MISLFDRAAAFTLRPRQKSAAGFTLLELTLVLTILGLLAVLVVFNTRQVSPATHARAAAQAISGGLRAARSEALKTNRGVTFSLDLENLTFRWGQSPQQTLPNDLHLSLLTGRDQVVSGAVGGIRFDPDGGSTGGRVTIEGGNRAWMVGVDWLSGRVTLAEQLQ